MPLLVNLHHVETDTLEMKGELPVEELELGIEDELIRMEAPLEYDLEVQKMDQSLLIQGDLRLALQCQCVRCLKEFQYELELEGWARHVPLEGEEKATIVNDVVDLTPYVREDILLEFPQHPLCEADCRNLPGKVNKDSGSEESVARSSAWAELDKLKFKK